MTAPASDNLATSLREAMLSFVGSVTIITTHWQDRDYAMPASAVNSVSFSPPSMLVCVNRTALIWQALSQGADFAINLIGPEQRHILDHCIATTGAARFSCGIWRRITHLPAILENATAALTCRQMATMCVGSHQIIVGEVSAIHHKTSRSKLAYVDREFYEI